MSYLGRKGAVAGLTSADIPDDSITASKIASGAITAADVAADMATQTELDALAYQGEPHIIPGVLYPAVSGKLLDGSTSHSGAYGTAQADGYSYYYTDIKGSKPIKDPRIGGHFGSQRHKTRSTQLLEQETAIHGSDVLSIDGREWMRWVKATGSEEKNDSTGHTIKISNGDVEGYVEFVGYFSDANISIRTETSQDEFSVRVDGGSPVNANLSVSKGSPLTSRYVDSGSVINLGGEVSNLPVTLGIHTVRIVPEGGGSNNIHIYSIELIAQDKFTDATCDYNNDPTITHDANTRIVAGLTVTGTGIPANATVASVTSSTEFELSAATTGGAVTNGTLTFGANNIQIPSQNVVSYGKKFTVSGTPHYDPFNGFVNDTTLFSSVVDVATSLGLGTATTWGAPWDKGSNNHIRPFNGGRVVKWVDSSGTIKTSVTMMPANAQNVGTTASNEITTASATNSHTINYSDDAVESSLAEVAKTFHWREFGNGAVNGGTGAAYADASMLNAADDIAYIMDDGLTSLAGEDVALASGDGNGMGMANNSSGDAYWFVFIGTGCTIHLATGVKKHLVQNLPYGTHIIELTYSSPNTTWKVDGVAVQVVAEVGCVEYITFHQPKKPPIPEDAVVLADYMLMADFVVNTTAGLNTISKGVRAQSPTRDTWNDGSASGNSPAYYQPHEGNLFIQGTIIDWSNITADSGPKLTYFGNPEIVSRVLQTATTVTGYHVTFDGTAANASSTNSLGATFSGGSFPSISSSAASPTQGNIMHSTLNTSTMGVHTYHIKGDYTDSTDDYFSHDIFEVVTPIHTSSHYQSFETPYLYELVGGDRNMEQTNLVVTSDGKTWDEVTRDTSYIGKSSLAARISADYTSETTIIFDDFRGLVEMQPLYNKDFAIAYDRFICLKDGAYNVDFMFHASAAATSCYLRFYINGTRATESQIEGAGSLRGNLSQSINYNFKRGDYLQISATNRIEGTDQRFHTFQITRL